MSYWFILRITICRSWHTKQCHKIPLVSQKVAQACNHWKSIWGNNENMNRKQYPSSNLPINELPPSFYMRKRSLTLSNMAKKSPASHISQTTPLLSKRIRNAPYLRYFSINLHIPSLILRQTKQLFQCIFIFIKFPSFQFFTLINYSSLSFYILSMLLISTNSSTFVRVFSFLTQFTSFTFSWKLNKTKDFQTMELSPELHEQVKTKSVILLRNKSAPDEWKGISGYRLCIIELSFIFSKKDSEY